MDKKARILIIITLTLTITGVLLVLSYSVMQIRNSNIAIENKISNVAPVKEVKGKDIEIVKEKATATPNLRETNEIKTTYNTLFEIHYFNENGELLRSETINNNNLINKNKKEISAIFKDYKIELFSKDKVILSKVEVTPAPSYILGQQDGYISIFEKSHNNHTEIIETTDILVSTLPNSDIELLREGITFEKRSDVYIALESYDN